MRLFIHIIYLFTVTPSAGEIVVLEVTRTTIRITWGDGRLLPGFVAYSVKITPSGQNPNQIDGLERSAVFSGLVPGQLYDISVGVDATTDTEVTAKQRTSESWS